MKLRYTTNALAELDQILTTIAVQSPQDAQRVQARVRSIVELLLQFPESGQSTTTPTLRRVVATPYPYLIFYQHIDDEIVIVGVRHGARDQS